MPPLFRTGAVLSGGLMLCALIAAPTASRGASTNLKEAQPRANSISAAALGSLGAPATLMMLREGDRIVQSVAVGIANRRTGRSATIHDRWRIASVTKMVTAVVVMQLVREGRLGLDNAVATYLPRAVPLADQITIRQLLNHTSGIPDYLAGPRVPINVSARMLKANLIRHRPFRQRLADANRQPRTFKPGEMHEYSNTNYLLLERIIARVSGMSYDKIVQSRVLKPLGLTHTAFVDPANRLPRNQLRGYVAGDTKRGPFKSHKRLVDVTRHDYLTGADGGLTSDLTDLTRLMDAIWSGPLLTAGERAAMTTDTVEDHDGVYRYGFGVAAYKQSCGITVYGHEGRDLGVYTMALSDRSSRRHLVVAVNKFIDDRAAFDRQLFNIQEQVFCGVRTPDTIIHPNASKTSR
ncbi:MAG: serine hydrolase domain-containing protein [Hyphomicrobiaceae bacterium]